MNHEEELLQHARKALQEAGFEPNFSAEIHQELKLLPPLSSDGALDLRDLLWSSIDNEDSRDLDQIEYAEPLQDGSIRLRLGVADVALFVPKGSAIDNRARQNTVTIYSSPKPFHLLPEELSTCRTSLLEGSDHRAMVIECLVDPAGELGHPQVYPALVRNRARLSYNQVAEYFGTGNFHWTSPSASAPPANELRAQLDLQREVSRRLMALRKRTGALTFSSFESRPVYKNGKVTALALTRHNEARDLIESFMVAANIGAATFLKMRGWPILERVVEAPRRWERIRDIAAGYGHRLPVEPHPRPLSEFLSERRAADPAKFGELSLSIVKLLGPGHYVVEYPEGRQTSHFGLALEDYSHSTAPNRRFSDLVLQRLLHALLAQKAVPYTESELQQIADHCTVQEDKARKLERRLRKIAAALLIEDRTGEVFAAIVTGAAPKGTYVRLLDPPVEGKVVRGDRGIDVGDQVQVRLVAVNRERGFIDFAVV